MSERRWKKKYRFVRIYFKCNNERKNGLIALFISFSHNLIEAKPLYIFHRYCYEHSILSDTKANTFISKWLKQTLSITFYFKFLDFSQNCSNMNGHTWKRFYMNAKKIYTRNKYLIIQSIFSALLHEIF